MLDDPFPVCTSCAIPANPILQPQGNLYGINQNLGAAMAFTSPVKVPYTERVSFDIQHQFGQNWMLEAGYIMAHGVHLSYNNAISAVPVLPYLSRSPFLDNTTTANLTSTATGFGVANPFKGLGAPYTNGTSNLTASKISATAALQAYPEYSSVTEDLIPGDSYTLEASSPGLDRKLSRPEDFQRFAGSLVKIQTFEPIRNNRHWQGRLTAGANGVITLDLAAVQQNSKSRKTGVSTVEIALGNIEKANLVPEI